MPGAVAETVANALRHKTLEGTALPPPRRCVCEGMCVEDAKRDLADYRKNKENAKKERDSLLKEAKEMKDRAWADWCDANPKGSGNKMVNRS